MSGVDESSDEESGSESEEESDDGSIDEEGESMPRLMDPSDSEDSKDDRKPTSHFIPGYDAYATTFDSAAPDTILSDSGAPRPYFRLHSLPITFDELVEIEFQAAGRIFRRLGPDRQELSEAPQSANRLDRIEHEPGKANAEVEGHTLGLSDRQTRQIAPQVAREVEIGSGTDARMYSALYGYPIVDEPWADCTTSVAEPLEAYPDWRGVQKWARNVWEDESGEDLREERGSICGGEGKGTNVDEGFGGDYTDWPGRTKIERSAD
ncbi:hypothetical protein GALMADRAFT_247043, partial [Galerina marginata CBS 339.88]